MSELPRPVTTDQEYLAAILRELRGVSAKLDSPSVENVIISEPAPVPSGELVQAVTDEVSKKIERTTRASSRRKA